MNAHQRRMQEIRLQVPEVSVDEAFKAQQSGALLLDVREPEEVAGGSPIDAARLVRGFLELEIEKLESDFDRQIRVICAGGTRSLYAARGLQELGYHRGELDGQMGGTTRESVRAYRYDVGLPISGAVDGPLLESLRPVATEETGTAEAGAPKAPQGTATNDVPQSAETATETWREPAPEPELIPVTPPPAE